MKVAIGWMATPDELRRVRERLPDDVTVSAIEAPDVGADRPSQPAYVDPDALIGMLKGTEVLFGYGIIPARVFEELPGLRFISYMDHGCDALPLALFKQRNVTLANAHGVWDHVVAEQTWAFILAFAKQLLHNNQAVIDALWEPTWDPRTPLSVSLHGESIAIVGLGGIGREIARRARAFGMRVLAVRRKAEGGDDPDADEVFGIDDLHDVLGRARFVVLAMPLTPATVNLIDGRALDAMRPDAYLINMARAPVVNERAVHSALVNGSIAGFASDVWWHYGFSNFNVPSRLGVHRLPNVLASGDRSNNILGGWERAFTGGLHNVDAYVRGQPLRHIVDLELGY